MYDLHPKEVDPDFEFVNYILENSNLQMFCSSLKNQEKVILDLDEYISQLHKNTKDNKIKY